MSKRKRFIPLHTGVLVRPNSSKIEDGGVYIPEVHQRKEKIGRVVEVGPEVRELRIGLMVVFSEFGHHTIHIDGVRHLLMDEEEVIAVLEED